MNNSFSKNAYDLFVIAVNFANFDKLEILKELHILQNGNYKKVHMNIMENALRNIKIKYDRGMIK